MTTNNNIEAIYRLTPTQEGMLFHTLYAPQSAVYFQQYTCTLKGNLDVPAFEQAWQLAVDLHPALRTLFTWERREKPLQIVRQRVTIPWEHLDWQDLVPVKQQEQLDSFLRNDRAKGFKLDQAPLMRLTLIKRGQASYQFVCSFHHLLMDGWSIRLLLSQVFRFYDALCVGQEPDLPSTRPFQDYIAWLRQQDLNEAEKFWKQQLKGFTAPTHLNVDRMTGPLPDSGESHEQQQIELSTATTAALQSFAKQNRLTLNTLIQGAWALILSRYSRDRDVIFGATVSGRPAALNDVETMIGMFINTLPVRIPVSPENSLLPWLNMIQTKQVEMLQYESSPLVAVQGWSDVPHGRSLFETIVVFENQPIAISMQRDGGLNFSDERYLQRSNYPLAVLVLPGQRLQLVMIQDTRRFETATITRMLGHLHTLLQEFAANPHRRIYEIPMLTEKERHQLLVTWNDTQEDYPRASLIHQLFEAQVRETPNAPAVAFENQELTYRELNRRANQLAHHLHKLGVGPEDLVGICLERSPEMIVAMLGTLKAGGAYVPIDPAYPRDRLAFMLEDSGARVLLTGANLVDNLPEHQAQLVYLDTDWPVIVREPDDNPAATATPQNLVYVIYTSGSTGTPKGVMITHQNLVHSATARMKYYPDRVDSFLLLSSFSFDSSVAGIYWTLCQGGKLVLPSQELEKQLYEIANLIADHAISHILSLPSLYGLLIEYAAPEQLSSLKTVIVAGEACSKELVKQHYALYPEKLLYNEYGPTEATVWSTVQLVAPHPEEARVPIGRPIANTGIFLLDDHLRPVPIGVPGELYIGGDGLARGYLNRPELTREKFIRHPYSQQPEARLYKTGDLARYLPDGTIEFLGRVDHQVKIRGYRIELEEIEAVLKRYPGIQDAAVVVKARNKTRPQLLSRDEDWDRTEKLVEGLLALGSESAAKLLADVEELSDSEAAQRLAHQTTLSAERMAG